MTTLLRLGLLLTAGLMLSGCQEAFDVTLAKGADRVSTLAFVVTVREAPATRPEYHTVKLIDRDTKALLWHLRASPFGTDASRATFPYGAAPPGFEAVVRAPETLPPGTYALVVSGKAHGQLTFRVDADGRVAAVD